MSALVEKNPFLKPTPFIARPDQPAGINATSANIQLEPATAETGTPKPDQPTHTRFKELLTLSRPMPA